MSKYSREDIAKMLMEGASIENADLREVDLSRANLSKANVFKVRGMFFKRGAIEKA